MPEEPSLQDLATEWLAKGDGLSAHFYGTALESAGRLVEAEAVYKQAIDSGYLAGYYDLAWLERGRDNIDVAIELLEGYVRQDDDPDDFTWHVMGVLGHWKWYFFNQPESEPLLRKGADYYPSARADLASLLKATDRLSEAIEVLQRGVEEGEVESFLPLANIHEENAEFDRAEDLFRGGFGLGDAFSAFNLYRLLDDLGREEEAAEWLWKAAQGGDELAIEAMARGLDEGTTSTE